MVDTASSPTDTDARSPGADLAIPASARDRFGIGPDWRSGMERLVEWRDVDAFRHANHTAFLLWFEAARNRYLEAMGLPRHASNTPGPVMMDLRVRYLRPLAYHEPVFVTVRTAAMRRRSLEMDYAAWTQDGCAATCTAVLVLMINDTGEKVAIPDAVRGSIRTLDNPREE
ncbi:MAG: thioesterase family protein [Alphaproteobacteria bacterium]|nr:thioesterase family protein [Alphaproteobacteria bacterium]